jgi:hypothetical protein
MHAFRRFASGFELFLSSGSFLGGIGLTGEGTGPTGVVPRCSAILSTGLTGESDRSDRSELS